MREGSVDTRTVPLGIENLGQARTRECDGAVDFGRKDPRSERVSEAIAHDRGGCHVLGDRDHPGSAHVVELPRRLRHRHRRNCDQHHGDHQQLEDQELACQAADAASRRPEQFHNDQNVLCVHISDSRHCWGPVLLSITNLIGDDVKRTHTRPMLVIAVIIALLVTACGVTRGDEERGFHRLRMMVPNSPGGGYDLTARTAVKILQENDITGRIEVFNVIGAGGTVAMARLMNEKGNDDLMMTMGLGVVGATYTNGSNIKASDATAIAKLIEDPGAIFVPADSPFKTVDDFVAAWKADPSKVTIGGGSSPGGPDHLFPMELAKAVGVEPKSVNFVTYDGGGDLLTALLGKKITVGTSSPGELIDQIEAGPVAGARGVQ